MITIQDTNPNRWDNEYVVDSTQKRVFNQQMLSFDSLPTGLTLCTAKLQNSIWPKWHYVSLLLLTRFLLPPSESLIIFSSSLLRTDLLWSNCFLPATKRDKNDEKLSFWIVMGCRLFARAFSNKLSPSAAVVVPHLFKHHLQGRPFLYPSHFYNKVFQNHFPILL